jgi:hypothetical protein
MNVADFALTRLAQVVLEEWSAQSSDGPLPLRRETHQAVLLVEAPPPLHPKAELETCCSVVPDHPATRPASRLSHELRTQ